MLETLLTRPDWRSSHSATTERLEVDVVALRDRVGIVLDGAGANRRAAGVNTRARGRSRRASCCGRGRTSAAVGCAVGRPGHARYQRSAAAFLRVHGRGPAEVLGWPVQVRSVAERCADV